jgi:hypothetical protein
MGLGDLHLSQEVPEEDSLELTNGTKIRSVLELFEAIKTLDEEHLQHHLSTNHNDFADWIEEHYRDDELTKKLQTTKKKTILQQLEKALLKEMKTFIKETKKKQEEKKIKKPKKKKDILTQIAHG